MCFANRFIVFIVAVLAGMCAIPQSANAQAIKSVLRAMDRDQNGYINPRDEMTPRLAAIVTRYGFNPDEYVEISSLISQIDEANARPAYLNNSLKRIPGFGNENDGDTIDTPGFGPATGDEMTDEELYSEFSESVTSQMERTLSKYDDDSNGIIDAIEKEDGRWRNPSFDDSDLNSDGALSKTELAKRYARREEAERAQEEAAEAASSNGDNEGRRNRDNDEQPQRRRGRQSREALEERAERYVSGMFERYDKNGDGMLDAGETAEMRRPPSGADADGDGNLTREEVKTFASNPNPGRNRGNQNSQSQGQGQQNERMSREERGSFRERRSAGQFSEYDKNGDGQIQMVEFPPESGWDGDVYEDWQNKDANRDGVVTPEEWATAPSSRR